MNERPLTGQQIGPQLPDRKMPCGCYGDLRQGNTQITWVVTATAFLCPHDHKQGDVIVAVGE